MSYNEVKELLAKTTGGHGTGKSIVTPILRKSKGKTNNPWKKDKESHKADFAGKGPPTEVLSKIILIELPLLTNLTVRLKKGIPSKKDTCYRHMTVSRSTRIRFFHFSTSTNFLLPSLKATLVRRVHLLGETCLYQKALKGRTSAYVSLSAFS